MNRNGICDFVEIPNTKGDKEAIKMNIAFTFVLFRVVEVEGRRSEVEGKF